ncbi:TPA: hypothetical protein ACF942_000767, partial [Klebsiella pneumoniae]
IKMTKSTNATVMASVCPKVEAYIKKNMVGYMSTSVCVLNTDNENQTKLYLCDKDSDVGTYQFTLGGAGSVVVSDYFDEDKIFGNNEYFKVLNLTKTLISTSHLTTYTSFCIF